MVRNPPADGAPAAVQPARRSMLPLLAVAGALLVAGSCSGREVRVERVDREVQLDADGQVVGSSASSTTFVTDTTAGRPTRTTATTTTAKRRTPALTVATAQNGSAAIDCGDGASIVTLSNGAGSLDAADGSTTRSPWRAPPCWTTSTATVPMTWSPPIDAPMDGARWRSRPACGTDPRQRPPPRRSPRGPPLRPTRSRAGRR